MLLFFSQTCPYRVIQGLQFLMYLQGSTLTFETGGPPGPPEANSTRPNSNLGGPVYNFIKSCINSYSTLGTINYFLCPWK